MSREIGSLFIFGLTFLYIIYYIVIFRFTETKQKNLLLLVCFGFGRSPTKTLPYLCRCNIAAPTMPASFFISAVTIFA
jgi:hypothetical protein